jgi:hypothetical protein
MLAVGQFSVKRGKFNSVKIHAPYITYVPHITMHINMHEKVNRPSCGLCNYGPINTPYMFTIKKTYNSYIKKLTKQSTIPSQAFRQI